MKANEKVCQNCLGLTKKTYYWNGEEYCEECFLKEVTKELDAIADAKAVLAERVNRLHKETGKMIHFGLDDAEEIYVDRGLDLIGKALQSKPTREEYEFGGGRETVFFGSTEFYTADLGV